MRRPDSQWKMLCLAALALGVGTAVGAEPPAVRAGIQPVQDRKQAPAFGLEDAVGRKVRLSDYRGKVVLLDFRATECGGCIREMPWFMDLAQAYGKRGLAVVGVSVDIPYENLKDFDEGWSRVKPFIRSHKVNYPILMGDGAMTKSYDIQALPLTLLVDKRGRIAATCAGVVDKNDVQANIETLRTEYQDNAAH